VGKVVDTNHESRGHKPSRHVEMFATKSVTSPRQTLSFRSNGIWSVTMQGESWRQSRRQSRKHKSRKSATQIMKVGDVICVMNFHDLCARHVRDFVGNLSRTLLQSRRNGIWAYAYPKEKDQAELASVNTHTHTHNLTHWLTRVKCIKFTTSANAQS